MRFSWQRWRWVGVGLALGLAARSFGHGPLDHSATITLAADQIEVRITLGPDLARKFFADHLSGTPLPQPVGPGASLPVTAVEKMFSLATTNGVLAPAAFRGLTDGLEYLFVATFPGVGGASLRFQAHYVALAEQTPPGALLVQTEDRRRLAAEVVSPARTVVEITHSVSANVPAANALNSAPIPDPPIKVTNQMTPMARPPAGRREFGGLMVVALALIIGAGLLLGRRRS